MALRFIPDESALIVDGTLVLGELHIGIESEMFSKGFNVKSVTDSMCERIIKIIKKYRPSRLVVLGDVKHNYLKISKQEAREIPDFFQRLCDITEVHVTLGNHDGLLKEILPVEVIVHESDGVRMGRNYFLHGNAWPSRDVAESKRLFMAHIHPAIEFIDDMGGRSVEFCWIRGDANNMKLMDNLKIDKCLLEEIVIVPPFNRKIGGMPVNRDFNEKDISPLTRNDIINIDRSDVYLLDGTHLGKVSEIRK